MFEPAATAALMLGLAILGTTRLSTSFVLYGLQAMLLGALAASVGVEHGDGALLVVGSVVVVAKGVGVPVFLSRTAGKIGCQRDTGTVIAPPLQMFLALAMLAILVLAHPFDGELSHRALPAVGFVMLGMLLMITRRLAISQIVGFLVLENGVFLYAIGQPHPMPFVVEIGALMDVLAGSMLAGILAFKISRSFEHIDVSRLTELRG